MRVLRFFGLIALAGLLVMMEGCAAYRGSGKRLTNSDLTLVSFGSVQGELAPCG
jgi:hypothetical protein